MIRHLLKSVASRAGIGVYKVRGRHVQDGLVTLHGDHFRSDPAFRAAYARGVRASNGVDPGFEWRVHVALWAARAALRLAGDFVECGVNAGFMSSAIMHALDWNHAGRRFLLIDTFAGPVASQFSRQEIAGNRLDYARNALAAGAYVTDMDRVRENFAEWPNAVVAQGSVPDILPSIDVRAAAFLHIDMNCALPEEAALRFFWDKLSPGAMVLLDDYCYYGHGYQRAAMDATASELGAQILSLPTGQGLIIR